MCPDSLTMASATLTVNPRDGNMVEVNLFFSFHLTQDQGKKEKFLSCFHKASSPKEEQQLNFNFFFFPKRESG